MRSKSGVDIRHLRGLKPPPYKPNRQEANADRIYTEDEIEFIMAMDAFKRRMHRPHPDCRDILEVAKALGYRKSTQESEVIFTSGDGTPRSVP